MRDHRSIVLSVWIVQTIYNKLQRGARRAPFAARATSTLPPTAQSTAGTAGCADTPSTATSSSGCGSSLALLVKGRRRLHARPHKSMHARTHAPGGGWTGVPSSLCARSSRLVVALVFVLAEAPPPPGWQHSPAPQPPGASLGQSSERAQPDTHFARDRMRKPRTRPATSIYSASRGQDVTSLSWSQPSRSSYTGGGIARSAVGAADVRSFRRFASQKRPLLQSLVRKNKLQSLHLDQFPPSRSLGVLAAHACEDCGV